MTEPNNYDRAAWAKRSLDVYVVQPFDELDADKREVLTDLIADLLLVAHVEGFPADDVLESAKMHFTTDLFEEERAS